MFKHLLIPTDGSELSEMALNYAIELAKALPARITVVNVTEPLPIVGAFETGMPFPEEEYEKGAAQLAQKHLSSAEDKARAAGVTCETVHIRDEAPAEGILQAAKDCGCDAIVMSTHSRHGLSRMILGSQANKVVTNSPIPVLVCPPPGR